MDGRNGQQPPACVQNAMMTKDKKPFSYTPGGIDLSQIKSPRMAKRLAHNAQLEGVSSQQQNRPSPLAQPNATHQPSMAAQAMGMPVQVFPTGPPPPPPIPSGGAPPPPPQPSKNHLNPQNAGAGARKSPSPQNFEPPPMGFRPEIKIPANPMATLKKVPKPKEKNDFWVEEYRKDRSKSPIPGFNEQMNIQNEDSPPPVESYCQQNDIAREQEAERRRQQQFLEDRQRQIQQQEDEKRKKLIQQHEEQRRLLKEQEEQRRQQIQQQNQAEELKRQQQNLQQAAIKSPGIDLSYSPLRSPAILQAQQNDQNRAQSPLKSPAINQTQQQDINRGASPMKSPAIQQIQNQYQQQIRASQSPQRTFPFSSQPVRVDSPIQSPELQPNLQRAQSPARINTQQTPIYTRNQEVTSPTQYQDFNQQPNRNVGSLYIPPVESENLKTTQSIENANQQRKGPPPNRWVSVQPSKDPPAWALQNNNQQQKPLQTVPSQQNSFASSVNQTPQHHMQPNLKLQINSNLSGSSNPREHIIPIQLEQTPTPTRTPSTPGFGPQPYNSNQQYSSVPSPGSNGSGYVMRNPNQFVDQGYNNLPDDPNRVRSPSSMNNGNRIIPIAIEGPDQSLFNPNNVRGPINQSPMVIKNDPRAILQHQNSWSYHNNINNGPNQSKSFRILQKITDTEDSMGLTATNHNNNSYNNYNNINKINNNRQINDSNQSNAAQRTNYSQQINNNINNGGYNDNYDTTEHMRRMHINNNNNTLNNNYPGTPIILRQPPCYVPFQHPIYYNQDQSQQQMYIHPSEQQPLPEPKIYTGSAIPSRSFKILQAMTTPENAADLEGSDVIEYEQISNSMPYYPPPYPPFAYGYPYPYPYAMPPPPPYQHIHHPYPYYPGYPTNFSNHQSVECNSPQNFDEQIYFPGVVRRRKSLTNRNQYKNSSQESLDQYNPSWRNSAPPNIIVTQSFDEKEEDEVNEYEKMEDEIENQNQNDDNSLNKFGIKEGSLAKLQQTFESRVKNDSSTYETKIPLKKQISLQENYSEEDWRNSFSSDITSDCKRTGRAESVTRSFSEKYDLSRKIRAKSMPRKQEPEKSFEIRRNLRAGSVSRSLKSIEIPEIPRFIREGSISRCFESSTTEISRSNREGSVLDMLSDKLNEINKSDTLSKNIIQDNDEKLYAGEKNKAVHENQGSDCFSNIQENYSKDKIDDEFGRYCSSSESEDEDDDDDDDIEEVEDIKNNLTKIKSIKSVTNIQVYNKNQHHIAIDDTSMEGNSSIFDDGDNHIEIDDEDDEIKSQIFEEEFTEEIDETEESETDSEELLEETDQEEENEIIIEDDLSVIFEESEHNDKELKRNEKLCGFHDHSNASESSNTIENNLDENSDNCQTNDKNLVTVRLPLKLSFSRSSNDENVTTVEVGNSEIEDQSKSFSVASIQDDDSDTDNDDTDDCDISVTISLSSSRSGSVDYKHINFKQNSVEEIKQNSESDVSVSFSLNMRDKFLKQTCNGDTTNNISEYNNDSDDIKSTSNKYKTYESSLMKNEDFWAAINESKTDDDDFQEKEQSNKSEENYKDSGSDNNNSENNNLENDFWADMTKSDSNNLQDDFWVNINKLNQKNLDHIETQNEDYNDNHETNDEEIVDCDTTEEDVDFWAEITKTEKSDDISQKTSSYSSDFYKNTEIIEETENNYKYENKNQKLTLNLENTLDLYRDQPMLSEAQQNECEKVLVNSTCNQDDHHIEYNKEENLYDKQNPLINSIESVTFNERTNLDSHAVYTKMELERHEYSSVKSKQNIQISQTSIDDVNLSRTSSIQRSESELEEDDSGVTDMNKLVSETDTESECFPELKKMTRYQRASTHSRLFKLLQNEDSVEDQSDNSPDNFEFRPSKKKIIHNVSITRRQNPNSVKDAESMAQRRERLSLPLKLSSSIDSDNLSTSNSPLSPTAHLTTDTTQSKSKVNDQLVNELVQSLLLKKNSEHFKNLPMEKLQAAAKRVLEEELDSSLDTCSVESTPAPTPQEFKTDLYTEYYDSWKSNSQNSTDLNKDFELIPSKAFKNLQEQSLLGNNKKKPWSFKCPRVLSSKTINRDLARVTESPEIYRGSNNIRSSCERDSDNNNNNSCYRKDNENKYYRKI